MIDDGYFGRNHKKSRLLLTIKGKQRIPTAQKQAFQIFRQQPQTTNPLASSLLKEPMRCRFQDQIYVRFA
jgi:hypothetical protein